MKSGIPMFVALVVLLALVGCAETPSTPSVEPPRQPAPVLDSAVLKNGVEVRLVSVSTTLPASWRGMTGTPPPAPLLFVGLEVVNSTDASLTVPSRPSHALVTTANGAKLSPRGTSARIDSGSNRFGRFAPPGPYIDPGGTMHVLFKFNTTSRARPLTVNYAPLRGESVTLTAR